MDIFLWCMVGRSVVSLALVPFMQGAAVRYISMVEACIIGAAALLLVT